MPPFQTTNFPWRLWMQWSEQPFSPRAPCQRWSLPPSLHTEDLVTVTGAATKSCPSSSGGAGGCSHIFQVTPNASTVPHPPVWSRATARYHSHLTSYGLSPELLVHTLVMIILPSCSGNNFRFDLERSNCTSGQHPSSFMGQTSGHTRHRSPVSATRPGRCSMKSHP